MTRVAIMGSGSWGTAFGMVLADAGSDVVIWGRDAEVAADINDRHRNDAYHPGIELPGRVTRHDRSAAPRPRGPRSSCWRCRPRSCATTSRRGAAASTPMPCSSAS